jgi:hypothetical protein
MLSQKTLRLLDCVSGFRGGRSGREGGGGEAAEKTLAAGRLRVDNVGGTHRERTGKFVPSFVPQHEARNGTNGHKWATLSET